MRSIILSTLAPASFALAASAPATQAHHGTFQSYTGLCDTLKGPIIEFNVEGRCVHMAGKSSFDISGKLPKGAYISYLSKAPKKDGSCDFSGNVAHGKVNTQEFCYPLSAIQAADFEVKAVWIQAA